MRDATGEAALHLAAVRAPRPPTSNLKQLLGGVFVLFVSCVGSAVRSFLTPARAQNLKFTGLTQNLGQF